MFAHTSPVYITLNEQSRFNPDVAAELVAEIKSDIEKIVTGGQFADDWEKQEVIEIYEAAIQKWESRIRSHR